MNLYAVGPLYYVFCKMFSCACTNRDIKKISGISGQRKQNFVGWDLEEAQY